MPTFSGVNFFLLFQHVTAFLLIDAKNTLPVMWSKPWMADWESCPLFPMYWKWKRKKWTRIRNRSITKYSLWNRFHGNLFEIKSRFLKRVLRQPIQRYWKYMKTLKFLYRRVFFVFSPSQRMKESRSMSQYIQSISQSDWKDAISPSKPSSINEKISFKRIQVEVIVQKSPGLILGQTVHNQSIGGQVRDICKSIFTVAVSNINRYRD